MDMPTAAPGMMSSQEPTQPTAPQGQDPNLSNLGKEGYNGVVTVEGQSVHVVNGICEFDNQPYFVSNRGEVVIDEHRNIVGQIVNGVFQPSDDAHIQQLNQMGVVEQ